MRIDTNLSDLFLLEPELKFLQSQVLIIIIINNNKINNKI